MKTETRHFDCSAADRSVVLTIASFEHRSARTGQEDARCEEVSNCNAAEICGVKTGTGTYNWSQCIHPDAPKT